MFVKEKKYKNFTVLNVQVPEKVLVLSPPKSMRYHDLHFKEKLRAK